MANKFKLAEAFTEFTIKGWTQFKARMTGARRLAMVALAPFRALGGLIRKLFTPLGLGLGALGIGALTLKLLQLSSAATETKQAFDSIFRESADDANAWVAQMANAYRRNETNVRQALLRFQTLFRGFGASVADSFTLSKLAFQLALDIEAAQNLPKGAAIDKVVSGLAGMIRPLRDVGVNVQQSALDAELMAQGFEKGSQNADQLTKSIVALKVINDTLREQGFIGQAARELTGFAAQFRSMMDAFQTLGERTGDLLIPVFKEVAFLASAIASVMGRVAKEILP
jgi:methyl-accepting chemotaxis protein